MQEGGAGRSGAVELEGKHGGEPGGVTGDEPADRPAFDSLLAHLDTGAGEVELQRRGLRGEAGEGLQAAWIHMREGTLRGMEWVERDYCLRCERHVLSCGPLSKRGNCAECAIMAQAEAVEQLRAHRGPAFDTWRDAVARSVGGRIEEAEET